MDTQQYDIIDKYIKGDISSAEANAFEVSLNTDDLLREEFELHKIVHETIVETNLEKLRAQMDLIDPSEFIQSNFWMNILGISAGVLGVLLMINGGINLNKGRIESSQTNIIVSSVQKPIQQTTHKEDLVKAITKTKNTNKEVPSVHKDDYHKIAFKAKKEPRSLKPKHRRPVMNIKVNETPKVIHISNTGAITQPILQDCNTELSGLVFTTESPCYTQDNGMVTFSGFEISKVICNEFDADNQTDFTSLKAGIYTFQLTGESGCVIEQKIELKDDFCLEPQSFSPKDGNYWSVPTFNQKGIVTIKGMDGQTLFSQSFEEDETVEWNGESQKGIQMNRGEYYFLIQFNDGKTLEDRVSVF